jgi:phosphoadenosine phosphosulfate reductase
MEGGDMTCEIKERQEARDKAADLLWSTTPHFKRVVGQSRDLIRRAAQIGKVGVSFSGGKDSLVTLHLVRSIIPDAPAALFDSGCEMPETVQMCEQRGVEIIQPRYTYPEMARYSGWFGYPNPVEKDCNFPVKHILIEEPAEAFVVRRQLMVSATGMRAAESNGREANYSARGPLFQRKDRTWSLSPIAHWSIHDVWAYIAKHKLLPHPIYARMSAIGIKREDQRLGASLGVINAQGGRFTIMKRIAPETFAKLAQEFPQLRDMA